MTVLGTIATGALWLGIALVGYVVVSALVLLYLPPADQAPSGAVADVAFVVTFPFVLAVTWLSGIRNRR